ncbi:hypothetical protein [Rickettsiella endosymbiont of Xylota segnis]|uniref:hypothetical protein n=1 Tax=Rickettsiella endosymbiont of Xylota segnis TaxID=3066238 RepID=UPI0030D24273
MQPRLIRLRDAPKYLGMDRNRFNNEVRPFLITLKIGQQGIAFDRLDLDQWADEFKKHKGQHAQQTMHWQGHATKILLRGKKLSKFTKKTTDKEFQQLVDHLSIRKSCITLP